MSLEQQRIITDQQKTIRQLHQQIEDCRGEEVGSLLNVIANIRESSGLGHEPVLTELPKMIGKMRNQIDGYEFGYQQA